MTANTHWRTPPTPPGITTATTASWGSMTTVPPGLVGLAERTAHAAPGSAGPPPPPFRYPPTLCSSPTTRARHRLTQRKPAPVRPMIRLRQQTFSTDTKGPAVQPIIQRSETATATSDRYQYTRTVMNATHTVRVRIERDTWRGKSHAVAEVFTDRMTWATLTADTPANWWHATPTPNPGVDATEVLGPVADRLVHRAGPILAIRPITMTMSPNVYGAISALLATSRGFDAEVLIDPDDVAWAHEYGGALHILEHPDGSVSFTKAHRDDCPIITGSATQDYDDECYFEHPADRRRRLGQ